MRMKLLCLIVSFGLCQVVFAASPPVWPHTYSVEGWIFIPYAELREPFTAWYEEPKHRSRIDYYNGTVKTYQRGDIGKNGLSQKVTPVTMNDNYNQRSCFQVNGTQIQSVLPNLKGFMFGGMEILFGRIKTYRWQNITKVEDKVNRYTFWVSVQEGYPVRYEMKGYDSLLGSHYDKYIVDYYNYREESPLDDNIFNVDSSLTCTDYPTPIGVHNTHLHNPIKEFTHHEDEHVQHEFDKFKSQHRVSYTDEEEHRNRNHIFRQNLRLINSKNRAGLSYTLAVNHLADKSPVELKQLRGKLFVNKQNNGRPFYKHDYADVVLPTSIDWRLFGAVTPVKDQSVCGSCWTFGTTGAVEGALFRKTGLLVRLSEQALVDCSWGQGNNGCDGGEQGQAYDWIAKYGIPTHESYGPYQGQNGYCHVKDAEIGARVKGYVNVTSGDSHALMVALATQGPIAVSIDASHTSFAFYSNGVYFEPDCGNKPDELDHAVLAVGYGVLNGEAYWLVKNSWSTYWGNDGYVLMSQRNNNCGVATGATFVLM